MPDLNELKERVANLQQERADLIYDLSRQKECLLTLKLEKIENPGDGRNRARIAALRVHYRKKIARTEKVLVDLNLVLKNLNIQVDAATVREYNLRCLPTVIAVYKGLLAHPMDTWRLQNQWILIRLRNCIAEQTGKTEQEIQEYYESEVIREKMQEKKDD